MAVVSFYIYNRNIFQKLLYPNSQIKPCCEKQCLHKLCTQNPDQVGRWRNKLEQKDSKSEDNRKVCEFLVTFDFTFFFRCFLIFVNIL